MPTIIENAVVTNAVRRFNNMCGMNRFIIEFFAAACLASCKRRSASRFASISRFCFLEEKKEWNILGAVCGMAYSL